MIFHFFQSNIIIITIAINIFHVKENDWHKTIFYKYHFSRV